MIIQIIPVIIQIIPVKRKIIPVIISTACLAEISSCLAGFSRPHHVIAERHRRFIFSERIMVQKGRNEFRFFILHRGGA